MPSSNGRNRVLLIEDSATFQLMVAKALNGRPIDLVTTTNAREALSKLAAEFFDLILLDIELPDSDGFKLLSEIQANAKSAHTPVFFLSGKQEITDKMTAFSLGADDYITKPFNPLELRARVEAKLRKSVEKVMDGDDLRVGQLHLSLGSLRAYRTDGQGGEEGVSLTPREFKILLYLARNEERVISRNQIIVQVWGDDAEVFDRTIDTHVCAIRRKLGDLAVYIESVPGEGYRLSHKASQKAA